MNVRTIRFSTAALAAFALSMLAPVVIGAAPADAVVYCKAVGVPKGCVARPTAAVVVKPTTTVIYCTTPGVPLGCVVRPTTVVVAPAPVVVAPVVVVPVVVAPRAVVVAPRAVVVPRPYNRGGPVNRVGRR